MADLKWQEDLVRVLRSHKTYDEIKAFEEKYPEHSQEIENAHTCYQDGYTANSCVAINPLHRRLGDQWKHDCTSPAKKKHVAHFTFEPRSSLSFGSHGVNLVEAGFNVGGAVNLGKGFEYEFGAGGSSNFDVTLGASNRLSSFDLNMSDLRIIWRWNSLKHSFSFLSPYVEGFAKLRFYPEGDSHVNWAEGFYGIGGGIEWYSKEPFSLWSGVQESSLGGSPILTTGLKFYSQL